MTWADFKSQMIDPWAASDPDYDPSPPGRLADERRGLQPRRRHHAGRHGRRAQGTVHLPDRPRPGHPTMLPAPLSQAPGRRPSTRPPPREDYHERDVHDHGRAARPGGRVPRRTSRSSTPACAPACGCRTPAPTAPAGPARWRCSTATSSTTTRSDFALMEFERNEGKTLTCVATPDSDVTIEADIEVEEGVVHHPVEDFVGTVVALEDIARETRRLVDRPRPRDDVQPRAVRDDRGSGDGRHPDLLDGQPARASRAASSCRSGARPGGLGTDGWVFKNLAVGDTVQLSGPYGRFFLREARTEPAILIGGGTGLAPLKSIVRHVLENGPAAAPVPLPGRPDAGRPLRRGVLPRARGGASRPVHLPAVPVGDGGVGRPAGHGHRRRRRRLRDLPRAHRLPVRPAARWSRRR